MSGEKSLRILALPVLPGFKKRILPVLAIYWAITAAFTLLGQPIALVIGAWATVTTIMLWPVGRALGLAYTSYRSAWFVVGVASMIGIPLFGYLIITSTDPVTKYVSLIALAVDIGVWGIPLCTRRAYCSPFEMFFRPDLLFGDGRLLAGGIVAIGFGMKFIFSNAPPGNIPNGNWFALFFVIVLALIQIIPLRGMMKMRNRLSRVLLDKWKGLGATAAREFYLILAVTALMFSFHNFFGGVAPFTRNVLTPSVPGLAIMTVSALFVIFVRSWYKKYVIGDPFVIESLGQSAVKHSIFAVGLIGFIYGYLHVMLGGFPRAPNVGADFYLTVLGLVMLVWGVVLLVPLRAWAQSNQRWAMMGQMVEVVIPRLNDDLREKVVGKLLNAVSELPEHRRWKLVKDMVGFLGEMQEKDREKVMGTQLKVLSSLPEEKRTVIMKAMDKAIGMK